MIRREGRGGEGRGGKRKGKAGEGEGVQDWPPRSSHFVQQGQTSASQKRTTPIGFEGEALNRTGVQAPSASISSAAQGKTVNRIQKQCTTPSGSVPEKQQRHFGRLGRNSAHARVVLGWGGAGLSLGLPRPAPPRPAPPRPAPPRPARTATTSCTSGWCGGRSADRSRGSA